MGKNKYCCIKYAVLDSDGGIIKVKHTLNN